jgi:hypothetical protein
MLTQKCHECALKHVATALSYAKEILGGHTEGNPLDHRIDMLGELCNLEHHLELIDTALLHEAQMLRRLLQSRGMSVNEADLQKLRDLYNGIEAKATIPSQMRTEASPCVARSRDWYKVVIDSPCDVERLQACHECLRRNVMNQIEVIALNPTVDVPDGVEVVEGTLVDYIKGLDDDGFIYMTHDDFIINRCDLNLLPDIYLQQKCKNPEKYKGCGTYPYEWDCGAPHYLLRDKVIETYDGDTLNDYYIKQAVKPAYNAYSYVVRVTDRLCCGVKAQAESGYIYATALTDSGFASLMEWLNGKWAVDDSGKVKGI